MNNEFEITYANKNLRFNGVPILILFNGETLISKDNKTTNFKFSKSDFLLRDLKANTITQQKNQEMKTSDIIECIVSIYNLKLNIITKEINEIINCESSNRVNLLKELYKRLVIPFYIPILVLIPYLLIFSSKEKKNYSKLKIITFITGIITIIFSEGVIKFLSVNLFENLLIFIAPIILFLFFYLIFFFKLYLKNLWRLI